MPAIKVYKSGQKGVLIPVSEAKVAAGYQCPWTGKLYATKKSYVKSKTWNSMILQMVIL